jgi:hypothetical protein
MAYISYDSGFLSIHSNEIIANFVKIGVKVDLFMPDNVRMHAKLHDECNCKKYLLFLPARFLAVFHTVIEIYRQTIREIES